MSESQQPSRSERLNFIIAVCAVLISAASFYATYIQADAAEKQVRAMTLPLLQFSHSNWDDAKEEYILSLAIQNGGSGPAVLHQVHFLYEDVAYPNIGQWINACCKAQVDTLRQAQQNVEQTSNKQLFQFITADLKNVIVSGQYEYEFFTYEKNSENTPLWEAINQARHKTRLKTCYCSLLEDCYQATGLVNVTPVNACDD